MEIYLTPKISCPAMTLFFIKMKNQRYFNVGNRAKDDSKKIPIFGLTLEPKFQSKGNILFLEGLSGHFEDYQRYFLEPLSDVFRIYTFNYRGHIGSPGQFNNKSNLDDAEIILEEIPGDTFILAHSYGANLATRLKNDKIKGIYCFEPLFDFNMLNGLFQLGINALKIANHINFLKLLDFLLDVANMPINAGFKNTSPLQSFAELSDVKEYPYEKPLAYAFTNKDIVYGTSNPVKQKNLFKRIKSLYPQAKNKSSLIKGLNHCLNLIPRDFAPFLKSEQGKDSDKILEDIVDFFIESSKS